MELALLALAVLALAVMVAIALHRQRGLADRLAEVEDQLADVLEQPVAPAVTSRRPTLTVDGKRP